MATIDHVTLRAGDLDASLELFSRSFELLAFGGRRFDDERFHEWNDFSIAAADDGHPPTGGSHIGFAATSRVQVDGWWEALTTADIHDVLPSHILHITVLGIGLETAIRATNGNIAVVPWLGKFLAFSLP